LVEVALDFLQDSSVLEGGGDVLVDIAENNPKTRVVDLEE
jgi:hypothetical protein